MKGRWTAEQRAIMEAPEAEILLLACPGSGKTEVLCQRVLGLLGRGVQPSSILALSFTQRSARALRDRLRVRAPSAVSLSGLFIGTLHAWCLRCLESPGSPFALRVPLTEALQRSLMMTEGAALVEQVPLLKGGRLRSPQDVRIFSQLVELVTEADGISVWPAGVQEAVRDWRRLLARRGLWDPAGLQAQTLSALQEQGPLREHWRGRLGYVLVDEAQDLSRSQWELIGTLRALGARIFLVGDPDQSIYAWRGARPELLEHYASRWGLQQRTLRTNFRSAGRILAAADRIIAATPGRERPLMRAAEASAEGSIVTRSFPSVEDESAWIAEELTRLREASEGPEARTLRWGDFAILLRSVRHDGGPILSALRAAGIPARVQGVPSLLATQEIESMVQLFAYLGRGEEEALHSGLEGLVRGGLCRREDMQSVQSWLSQLRGRLGERSDARYYLQRVYLDLLARLGLREERLMQARSSPHQGESLMANLGRFSVLIREFELLHPLTPARLLYAEFADFLEQVAPDHYSEGLLEDASCSLDAVSVMTVHQAKGMEWPCVILPALRANRFPARRAGGRQWFHVLPQDSIPHAEALRGRPVDERRLLYVAMTRAQRRLVATWAPRPEKRQQRRVSPFYEELVPWSVSEAHPAEMLSDAGPETAPEPSRELSTTELRELLSCPYRHRLHHHYQFQSPLERVEGYGESLHAALAELHWRAAQGESLFSLQQGVAPALERHLRLPLAPQIFQDRLRSRAEASLIRYLRQLGERASWIEWVERDLSISLSERWSLSGRVDLSLRSPEGEVTLIELKSWLGTLSLERAYQQLACYAVGYQEHTRRAVTWLEVVDLETGRHHRRRAMAERRQLTQQLESSWSEGRQQRPPSCGGCSWQGICRSSRDSLP